MMDNPTPGHGTPRPKGTIRASAAAVFVALALATVGCTADIIVRGNAVDQEKLTQIQPGVQDRGTVRELLGSPTNVATFDNETWYYITQKDQTVAFSKARPLWREVVAISFNGAGRVTKVKKYSLADGRKIKPVDRKTPTPGQEFGLIQQLIGNLGRFEQPGGADGL